ncbi:hypothetical protein MUO66_06380 [Candidatus Bathyarchaeota archaeon]|nr:hypothetical protein [Candidatus Bathyarchaeota archaeon]
MKGFSKFPLVVLIIGILLVVGVFLISFSPLLSSFEPVENITDAKNLVDHYIAKNYPLLEVEEIMEFSSNFYVIVKETSTQNSALELLIDRNSGRIHQEPGPNMMWNTKYGYHNRLDIPTTQMPIDAESAVMIAQEWLNNNIFGKRVEETSVFYGYYTMDFSEKGQIFGMLSVNGYSGEVWYHSWHGDFISMIEYE